MNNLTLIEVQRKKEIAEHNKICIQNNFIDPGDTYPPFSNLMRIMLNDKKIGYIAYEDKMDSNRTMCIWGFYIEPEYRNQGLGQRAFEALLNYIWKYEPTYLPYVNVEIDNQIAQHIYMKWGKYVYRDTGELYVSPLNEYQIVFKRGRDQNEGC